MIKAVNGNVTVICNSNDLAIFNPPPGQTCGEYSGAWASNAAAQLLNPNATTSCNICKWSNGNQYLDGFNLGQDGLLGNKWAYWGIFLIFTVVNVGLVYFFTWATKVKRWKLFYLF
jgi:ATP-binding cassette subfamily G (WHITE) protein 2 (SNQ2)